MNNYCGFIEVWATKYYTNMHDYPIPIHLLEINLDYTKEPILKLHTVAVFKIKLK